MSLTSSAASLVRSGRTDKALALLEQRLDSSVTRADELLGQGARLPANLGSLHDSPRRAQKYASEQHLDRLAARAAEVAAKLK
jgi:hypothetical protein